MAKSRHRHHPNNSVSDTTGRVTLTEAAAAEPTKARKSVLQWLKAERHGVSWVIGCSLFGFLFGIGIGTGHFTGESAHPVTSWRFSLGVKIRSTLPYRLMTLRTYPWDPIVSMWNPRITTVDNQKNLMGDPSNPRIYLVLREAIVREPGGYVHPDLGMLIPAPSGAARGVGMVRDSYNHCQRNCFPGIASEKRARPNATHGIFKQEEVLIRVPLGFQMTRRVALDTLMALIPAEVQRIAPLYGLDDAVLLAMCLAHERGLSRASRWVAYIASLPTEPSCGYSSNLRPYMLDAIAAMEEELGLEVGGWPAELENAGRYADRIVSGLSQDYGPYLRTPAGIEAYENIEWALCQVASRATAASEKHGSLRLVPLLDMINHDAAAGGFVELIGKERLAKGSFIDATEDDSGTFVVRSIRHGRRKPLKKGQELMANYNVPSYSPLDWFVSLGFVPSERWHRWQKVNSALPRVRRDLPFAGASDSES